MTRLMSRLLNQLLPAPLLSLALFLLWMVLNRSLSLGQALVGLVLSLAIPVVTRGLRPLPVRVRKPGTVLRLALRVLGDSLRSNIDTLYLFLRPSSRQRPAGFVHVPLDLRDPNALAVLAMIVCITPGTSWAELSSDHSVLLLHLLQLQESDAAVVAEIKERYERPLMEIFE